MEPVVLGTARTTAPRCRADTTRTRDTERCVLRVSLSSRVGTLASLLSDQKGWTTFQSCVSWYPPQRPQSVAYREARPPAQLEPPYDESHLRDLVCRPLYARVVVPASVGVSLFAAGAVLLRLQRLTQPEWHRRPQPPSPPRPPGWPWGGVVVSYLLGFVIRNAAKSSPFFADIAGRRRPSADDT